MIGFSSSDLTKSGRPFYLPVPQRRFLLASPHFHGVDFSELKRLPCCAGMLSRMVRFRMMNIF